MTLISNNMRCMYGHYIINHGLGQVTWLTRAINSHSYTHTTYSHTPSCCGERERKSKREWRGIPHVLISSDTTDIEYCTARIFHLIHSHFPNKTNNKDFHEVESPMLSPMLTNLRVDAF